MISAGWQVGKAYLTRGGWVAIVIWRTEGGYYAIHKPHLAAESVPIWHERSGAAGAAFGVNIPPAYEGHPADLTAEAIYP